MFHGFATNGGYFTTERNKTPQICRYQIWQYDWSDVRWWTQAQAPAWRSTFRTRASTSKTHKTFETQPENFLHIAHWGQFFVKVKFPDSDFRQNDVPTHTFTRISLPLPQTWALTGNGIARTTKDWDSSSCAPARTGKTWTRLPCTQYSGCMSSVRSLPRSWRGVGL